MDSKNSKSAELSKKMDPKKSGFWKKKDPKNPKSNVPWSMVLCTIG
jgi:hypothetical protein